MTHFPFVFYVMLCYFCFGGVGLGGLDEVGGGWGGAIITLLTHVSCYALASNHATPPCGGWGGVGR